MCEFVVNSFPFEIIMMGTAARRAGEPFVQQFLDKHSRAVLAFPSPLRLISSSGHANAVPLFPGGRRLCLRRPTRCALFLRRVTPTRSHFPGRTSPLLAFPSPLHLIPSPRHANTIRIFTGGRRLCLRRPPRYALFLRRATPTRSHFSRADAAFVCAAPPAAPYFFASPRQYDQKFPGRTPPLLAPPYPLRLIPPPRHANTTGNILTCWRIWVLENKKAG